MKRVASRSEDDVQTQLGQKLRALRLARGWNMKHVAAAAGISRTTLCHLERSETGNPHVATLHKLAGVYGVPAETLTLFKADETAVQKPGFSKKSGFSRPSREPPNDDEIRRRFDRETNPAVAVVAAENPQLFIDWREDEWDELYSQFATGGALTEEGVRTLAEDINRNRETVQQLRILLNTHLGHVAAEMVGTLYRMVSVEPAEPYGEQKP